MYIVGKEEPNMADNKKYVELLWADMTGFRNDTGKVLKVRV